MIIGIDPGDSGAIAVLDRASGALLDVFDMPSMLLLDAKGRRTAKRRISPEGLALVMSKYAGCTLWIEEVASRPGQGVASTFAFGTACGLAQGVAAALSMQMHKVTPQRWQKRFDLAADKPSHRACAQAMWPDRAALFARCKDDGRADAALIAAYGRSLMPNPQMIGFVDDCIDADSRALTA